MQDKMKDKIPIRPDHGTRIRAGQLLSQYLREISFEETEMVCDPKTGEDRMATKAEALARKMWQDALGYTEKVQDEGGKLADRIHAPNRAAQCLLFDRIEGRAPTSIGEGDSKMTAADRMSEQCAKRIEKAGKLEK